MRSQVSVLVGLLVFVLLVLVVSLSEALALRDMFSLSSSSSSSSPSKRTASEAGFVQAGSLPPAKRNKVSKLLHFAYEKSHESVYEATALRSSSDSSSDRETSDEENSIGGCSEESRKWENKSDDEILRAACQEEGTIICKVVLKLAMQLEPDERTELANSIRKKPGHVNAARLLYHKLLERTIQRVESKGYDEKLDKMIDLLAATNPYALIATKVVKMAL